MGRRSPIYEPQKIRSPFIDQEKSSTNTDRHTPEPIRSPQRVQSPFFEKAVAVNKPEAEAVSPPEVVAQPPVAFMNQQYESESATSEVTKQLEKCKVEEDTGGDGKLLFEGRIFVLWW